MFVYQNGKLYIQKDDKLIGVEIYPDNVILLEDIVAEYADEYELLSYYEVQCKFNIIYSPYIFPKEVSENESNSIVKKPVRKSTRK